MGNTLDQYRGAIGAFYSGINLPHGTQHTRLSSQFCTFWLFFLFLACMNIETDPWIAYLLTLGMDVEKNPGPTPPLTTEKNISICNINLRSINAKSRYPDGISRFTAFKHAVMGGV